jgi:hypothetical protein
MFKSVNFIANVVLFRIDCRQGNRVLLLIRKADEILILWFPNLLRALLKLRAT